LLAVLKRARSLAVSEKTEVETRAQVQA